MHSTTPVKSKAVKIAISVKLPSKFLPVWAQVQYRAMSRQADKSRTRMKQNRAWKKGL